MSQFQQRLEEIAANSLYDKGVNATTIRYSFKVFKRYIKGQSLLEMGPAEGVMTKLLVTLGLEMTCVDGSKKFCDDLKARHPDLTVTHSLFEDFEPGRKFDNVVLGHVLEHVVDPVEILTRAKAWLTADGLILTAVPNALSIHRQAAVIMGLTESEKSMSDLDRHHGHYRVFDPFEFRQAFRQAGLSIVSSGGYWLKPVSNRQTEETWSEEMVQAFMELGERYPDIAAEQYVVASL